MSSEDSSPSAPEPGPPGAPEELPPVTPPSAGFIIQLFLIPALIVAAVIGVWGLFGQLAGSEVNLDQLVAELGNNNEHRRWRAAHSLYVLLQNDRQTDPDAPDRLSARRDLAEGLTGLLNDSLESPSTDDTKVLNQQVFLARTMGSLEADDLVLPALANALSADQDIDVRKSAMMSLALIADRHFSARTDSAASVAQGVGPDLSPLPLDARLPLSIPSVDHPEILSELKNAAQDNAPSLRHLTAFTLGLISGPDAIEQLKVLLLDADDSTRVNAAIALSRNAETAGIPTILKVLQDGTNPVAADQFADLPESEQADAEAAQLFDQSTALVNCLTAVARLWNRISQEDRVHLETAVETLADVHSSPGIRLHAKAVLREIQASPEPPNA